MNALIKYNYQRLGWLAEIRETLKDPTAIARLDETVIETKQNIRRLLKKEDSRDQIVKDYGIDGALYKQILPAWIETLEEAERYFMENLFIEARPSMYDCTGQLFTGWYHIGKLAGRFVAYHRIDADV